jgi:hypothetical protein
MIESISLADGRLGMLEWPRLMVWKGTVRLLISQLRDRKT